MLGIGSTELVLILFFGFLIFGPEKLPEMGRVVGRAIRQFRVASDQVNTKFKEEVYDPFQEAIDPYKDEIEKTVSPIREDIDSINDSLKETERMLKDPLDMKTRKQELHDKERELKESMGVAPGMSLEDKIKKDADYKAKKEAEKATKTAAPAGNAPSTKTAADAKGGAGIDVDDPFAAGDTNATSSNAMAKSSDDLAALYDFDSKDGE